jgi:hypothetical protein
MKGANRHRFGVPRALLPRIVYHNVGELVKSRGRKSKKVDGEPRTVSVFFVSFFQDRLKRPVRRVSRVREKCVRPPPMRNRLVGVFLLARRALEFLNKTF